MLADLGSDNEQRIGYLRVADADCEEDNDVASTSLIEMWIDELEGRKWLLCEATRSNH